MHAISPPRKKNPAEKAAYLMQKKAVYLSCQKRQSTSPAKNGSLPQEEEEAGRRSRERRKEKNKIIK